MPGSGKREFNCALCHRRTKEKERRPIGIKLMKHLQTLSIGTSETDVLCGKCRLNIYLIAKNKNSVSTKSVITSLMERSQDSLIDKSQDKIQRTLKSPKSICLSLPSVTKSHARCFICKKPGPKLVVIPSAVRISTFLEHNVIINSDSRCCASHMDGNSFKSGCLLNIPTACSTYVNRTDILTMLESLRQQCNKSQAGFAFDSLGEEQEKLTGLKKVHFDEICMLLSQKMRNSPVRSVRTTVGIFFFKLKSGISNKIMSTLFALSVSSVRRAISSVRKLLMQWFVPLNLGLNHISRQDIIEHHTRPLAQSLFGSSGDGDNPKLILVLDGTYIYIQKSNNFAFQRRSYSVHKGRNLIKPMVIVTTTGYFVTIVGPYLADGKNSDASILKHIMQSNVEDVVNFIQKDDIFVVDRGFRDSLNLLEEMGIKAEMPVFMTKGLRQLNTEDANASRMVTKVYTGSFF